MKTLTKLSVLILLLSIAGVSKAQTTVWATINNKHIIPSVNSDGTLYSASPQFQELINQYNITSIEQALPSSRKDELQKVYEFNCDCDQNELIADIAQSNLEITKPEPGPEYELLYVPNDYDLVFSEDYALELINADSAWSITHGDTAVDIAISDTNYDYDHEELDGQVSIVGPGIAYSDTYHGTAVAITAAGGTDNETGKSSIGYDCGLQLYAMSYNSMLTATYNGARVINVSWASSCFLSSYYQNIVDEVYENGSIIVASAGNGGTCGDPTAMVYPAALNHVISVTSVGPSNNHERTIGDPTTTHQHNDSVDIAAPGYDVALTVASGWYLTGNGTSFAAPYVSGTIGLMLSVNPCLTFEDVESILKETAYNLDTMAINSEYAGGMGAGRLDAALAVTKANEYSNFNIEMDADYSCSTYDGAVTVDATIDGGIAPFEYSWNTGGTEATLAGLSSGTYSVLVTDAKGCKSMDTVTLDVPEALEYDSYAQNLSCYNEDDGLIELDITGGVDPYELLWDTGDTTASIEELSAGSYKFTLTDADGCVKSEIIEITEPEELLLNMDVVSDLDTYGAGSIDLTVTGGTPTFEFEWSNGETTKDIEALDAGFYEVYVTDANGCTTFSSATVDGPVASVVTSSVDETEIYPNPAKGNATINVQWGDKKMRNIIIVNASGQLVKNDSVQSGTKALSISNLAAGTYMVQFIAEDNSTEVQKLIVQ